MGGGGGGGGGNETGGKKGGKKTTEVGFEPTTLRLQCTGRSGEQWLVLVSSWLALHCPPMSYKK